MSDPPENQKSAGSDDSLDQRAGRSELLGRALGLYIEKIKRENQESRSWIRQPNNLISVVAIVLSLMSLGYGFLKDYYDGIDKNLQSLSTVVTDLTKLDSDILTATLTDPQRFRQFGLVLNNRRLALLTEADRLVDELGGRVPVAQLAVLGPEYQQVNDYTTAIKYFPMTAERTSSPTVRSEVWRSEALVYQAMGPDHDRDARDAFAKAAQVFPDPRDVGSIAVVATIYDQWAQFEASRANYADALSRFAEARRFAAMLPCPTPRSEFIAELGQEATRAFSTYNAKDPGEAAKVVTLESANGCS